MQISGVYKNCICYAGVANWVKIAKKNPLIQLANDTEAARQASAYWMAMGGFATGFMALNVCVSNFLFHPSSRGRIAKTCPRYP
jgi:hypothetical protein